MSTYNVVVSFTEKDAAFSFLAQVDELGYRGCVVDADTLEEQDWTEYEETPA